MLSVLRYPIHIADMQTVLMHPPVQILSLAQSRSAPDGLIDVWAIGDDATTRVPVNVYIVGTGHPLPGAVFLPTAVRVGTVVTPSQLVWHVWAVLR